MRKVSVLMLGLALSLTMILARGNITYADNLDNTELSNTIFFTDWAHIYMLNGDIATEEVAIPFYVTHGQPELRENLVFYDGYLYVLTSQHLPYHEFKIIRLDSKANPVDFFVTDEIMVHFAVNSRGEFFIAIHLPGTPDTFTIKKVSPDGITVDEFYTEDPIAHAHGDTAINSMKFDTNGDLIVSINFVLVPGISGSEIIKLSPLGERSVFLEGSVSEGFGSLAFDLVGNLYVVAWEGQPPPFYRTSIIKVTPAGQHSTFSEALEPYWGSTIAFNKDGNLYVTHSMSWTDVGILSPTGQLIINNFYEHNNSICFFAFAPVDFYPEINEP